MKNTMVTLAVIFGLLIGCVNIIFAQEKKDEDVISARLSFGTEKFSTLKKGVEKFLKSQKMIIEKKDIFFPLSDGKMDTIPSYFSFFKNNKDRSELSVIIRNDHFSIRKIVIIDEKEYERIFRIEKMINETKVYFESTIPSDLKKNAQSTIKDFVNALSNGRYK